MGAEPLTVGFAEGPERLALLLHPASTATKDFAVGIKIPPIVHQAWKSDRVPSRWRHAVESVRKYHPGWEYRLWTDAAIDAHVRLQHPAFYPVFAGFSRHIMRVDVFRYILMHDFGGLYCDLDYEFLRPFDYRGIELLLSLERDRAFGDEVDLVANYVFASVPGHPFWRNVLGTLAAQPPEVHDYFDVGYATGSVFLTSVLNHHRAGYGAITLLPKPVLSPLRVHGRRERKQYLNSTVTYGFHHGWGSWKERMSVIYLRTKLAKWFAWRALDPARARYGRIRGLDENASQRGPVA
jgi:mannosyltransferase OCH1-like enzyme